jgi:hypothetical protein
MAMKGYLDEYEKLVIRMNTPRVVIDNGVCSSATIVKVDSSRRNGILLEAVQILTDLNLSIKKAYISSDGTWNMDVFHVTDLNGNKLNDQSVLRYIEQVILRFMNLFQFKNIVSKYRIFFFSDFHSRSRRFTMEKTLK